MKRRESLKVLGSIPFLALGGISSVEAKQIETNKQSFATEPKNIILVLADGMGVAQWQAGAIGNGGKLNVGRMTNTGLMTTNPLDNFCGDAPSHCTALACGINSHKGAVGVDKDDKPVKNIIEMAKEANIPVISSMGAGNKINPAMFEVADIYETSICPLAKVMRHECKKRGIRDLKVVYSKEKPIQPQADTSKSENDNNTVSQETTGRDSKRRAIPGSTAFVPSVVGLIIAGEIINDITGIKR